MRLVLQFLHHLYVSLLNSFQQHYNLLVTGSLEQDTALQVWPQQWWVEGKDHFPWPPRNILPNTAQETLGLFLLWGCIAGSCSSCYPPGLSQQAAFQPLSPQHVLVHGINPPQMQSLALPFVELHKIPLCPFLQPVKVSLNGGMTIWCINQSPQFDYLQTCWRYAPSVCHLPSKDMWDEFHPMCLQNPL